MTILIEMQFCAIENRSANWPIIVLATSIEGAVSMPHRFVVILETIVHANAQPEAILFLSDACVQVREDASWIIIEKVHD
jgi:hypothetical protein